MRERSKCQNKIQGMIPLYKVKKNDYHKIQNSGALGRREVEAVGKGHRTSPGVL